jgi:hypothetical protein
VVIFLPGVAWLSSVNCELPDHTHREIVDIAMLASSNSKF